MAKSAMTCVVAVLGMTGPVLAQGEVVSVAHQGVAGSTIYAVPAGGFVLTDIVFYNFDASNYLLQEVSTGGTTTKFYARPFGTQDGPLPPSYHFESGIAFAGNSTIVFQHEGLNPEDSQAIVISGYIPSSGFVGGVPAVGTIGLVVMVCMLLGAGGTVLRRRVMTA